MLRVVVAAPPAVASPEDLGRLPAAADLVELRLDLLPGADTPEGVARWIAASPRPVLATLRRREEGGGFDGPAEVAAARLEAAARAGAAWLDVETAVAPHLGRLPAGVAVLASTHHGAGAPLPRTVAGRPVTAWKVAGEADDADALLALGRAADGDHPPAAVVPFGALGALRVLYAGRAPLLFGAAAAGAAVVAGQPSLVDLLDDLRAGEVTPGARRYALLGAPPSPSPSPALHNAAFRAHGLDAVHVPLPGVGPRAALRLGGFHGFSVTTPFKAEALAVADRVDAVAGAVGAANTLVRGPDGRWTASNTDVEALLSVLPPAVPGASAFVLGAGGYARAALHALRLRGYQARVGARRPAAAEAVARALDVEPAAARWARRETDAVLVNATPLGADGRRPEPLGAAPLDGLLVLDAPYAARGRTTGLVEAAAGRARAVVDGRALLLAQARGQVARFAGAEVDDVVLELALAAPPPLVLLGLRGAGKSTVGRALAAKLGRPFVDLDEEVVRITGRGPGAWIREEGEAAFRTVELRAIERQGGRRGIVVAAGGGVVESGAARTWLAREATCAWLDLSPEVAAARVAASGGDRPPLAGAADPGEEARRLLARRRDAWRDLAAIVVDATGPVDAVTRRVADAWLATAGLRSHGRAPRG